MINFLLLVSCWGALRIMCICGHLTLHLLWGEILIFVNFNWKVWFYSLDGKEIVLIAMHVTHPERAFGSP